MKMRNVLYLLVILISIGAASCSKKTSGKLTGEPSEESLEARDTLSDMPEEAAARLVSDTLLFFQKTACFGSCPTYDVLVMANGEVNYNGINHVSNMGLHVAKLDVRQLAGLLKEASMCNFFGLADEYPEDESLFIADLSNTIIYLKQGDLKKRVFINNEAPEELVAFEHYLSTLFGELEYTPKPAKSSKK